MGMRDTSAGACPRLAVFISGHGSNLQVILDAIQAGEVRAQVVVVVSNRKDAYGLVRARQAGIPTLYAPLKPYQPASDGRTAYDRDLAERMLPYQPDLLVLVGWLHIFSPAFLEHFPRRVVNLHPALPGMFPGLHAIERAYAAYQQGEITHSGCMIHEVVPEVDAGPVIQQVEVPIFPDDTLDAFTERMHAAEHRLVVAALRLVCGS